MANQTIDNALITQFSDMFAIQSQQKMAKSAPFLTYKVLSGDEFAYDGLGALPVQEATSRNPKIEWTSAKFLRRQIVRRRFYVAVPLDQSDVRGMMLDPQGSLINACVYAMNRKKDRVIVEAAFADVKTGRKFDTTVTFANDNGLTVDATSGLTYDKLLEIQENFKKRDVNANRIALFQSEQEESQLLKETELTSFDFTIHRPVDKGMMSSAMGVDFPLFGSDPIDIEPILSVSGGVRDCVAIAVNDQHSGMCLAVSKDIKVKVQERSDYLETDQIVVVMEMGAVRTEGALVQKVQTTAS